jgi:signal transduction histidine kinase
MPPVRKRRLSKRALLAKMKRIEGRGAVFERAINEAVKRKSITLLERHDLAGVIGQMANLQLAEAGMFELESRKPNLLRANALLDNARRYFDLGMRIVERGASFKPETRSARSIARAISQFPRICSRETQLFNQLFKPYDKGIKIVIHNRAGNVPVKADIVWLSRLILNLTRNAERALVRKGEKGDTITIDYSTDAKNFIITVSDNGPGMTSRQKQDFYTGRRFTTKEEPGHGLGLAVVRKAVQLHRGAIEIRDNKPRGTIFVVKIPRSGASSPL